MYTRNKIALLIENKIGYTNGRIVDDETYERECLMIADELIKLFPIQVFVGQNEKIPELTLDQAIEKAKPNMDKIKDVDAHLNEIKWDGTTEY